MRKTPNKSRMTASLPSLDRSSTAASTTNTTTSAGQHVLQWLPPQLLKEIILVDDGSDAKHLGAELDAYVAALPKTRLIRQGGRTGLVQARLAGMRAATAETVTVLDSHIETQDGWLEPLMSRMRGDPTRVVIPIIDGMNAKTFQASVCVCLCVCL